MIEAELEVVPARPELTRRGHRFRRYADDCNIYVRSRRAGEQVMTSASQFLTKKLRLKVNEAKSAVMAVSQRLLPRMPTA